METRSRVSPVEMQLFWVTQYSASHSRALENNNKLKGKNYFTGVHILLGAFLAWSSQLPDSCYHCEGARENEGGNQYLNLNQPETSVRVPVLTGLCMCLAFQKTLVLRGEKTC